MNGPSRVLYQELDPTPEGKPRKRYVRMMTDEEFTQAIFAYNGVQDVPGEDLGPDLGPDSDEEQG